MSAWMHTQYNLTYNTEDLHMTNLTNEILALESHINLTEAAPMNNSNTNKLFINLTQIDMYCLDLAHSHWMKMMDIDEDTGAKYEDEAHMQHCLEVGRELLAEEKEQQGGADLTATGYDMFADNDSENCASMEYMMHDGSEDEVEYKDCTTCWGYCSTMGDWACEACDSTGEVEVKKYDITSPEVGLVDNEHVNLNTEAAPMTKIDMNTINKSSFISIVTATLHNNGRTPVQSLVIATGLMNYLEELGNCSLEEWIAEVTSIMGLAVVKADDNVLDIDDLDGWFDTVVHAGLITEDGLIGERLVSIILETEKAYPQAAFHGVTRRKPIMPFNSTHKAASNVSTLMQEAIDVLQATQYNVDEFMLRVSLRTENKEERYVLDGCKYLVKNGNVPVVAEFFGDRRGRLYQGDAHGPNGQSSDMARALMDLHGVHTDYDIAKATQAVRDEMADMVCVDLDVAITNFRCCVNGVHSAANYIMSQVELKQQKDQDLLTPEQEAMLMVTKPYSFTKAVRILNALEKGERPYIGMAFGLDAKCSGPQYGAIMTGDREIARACGFSTQQQVDDAYMIAMSKCESAGIHGLTRSLIKKPYMGIFYGQGVAAFAESLNYDGKQGHDPRLLTIIQTVDCAVGEDETKLEAQAAVFHLAICNSFGKMKDLRTAVKSAHYNYDEDGMINIHTTGPTMHNMGDNTMVAMDYKIKTDIRGIREQYDVKMPDVTIEMDGFSETFLKMAFKTTEHDLVAHGRSGFVNMIQATDALVARHIVSNMGSMGAQHTIAVHDCFRTNINDFLSGKLHQSIEYAYDAIFTEKIDANGDILANYFQGVYLAGGLNKFGPAVSMFKDDGSARLNGFGMSVIDIAYSLESGATYFSK